MATPPRRSTRASIPVAQGPSKLQIMAARSISPDKGFIQEYLDKGDYPDYIYRIIEAHRWGKFCRHEDQAVSSWVKEFYAGITQERARYSRVRGVKISMKPAVIQELYELPQVEDEFQELRDTSNEQALADVLAEIGVEGARWTVSSSGTLTLARAELNPIAKVWYHFVRNRIMPTSHTEYLTKDRAILLYCVMDGRPIDIARVIRDEMILCSKADAGWLWFPGLITKLCSRARLIMGSHDETSRLLEAITPSIVTRMYNYGMKKVMGGTPAKMGEASASAAKRGTPGEGREATPPGASEVPHMVAIEARLFSLEEEQKKLRRDVLQKLEDMDAYIQSAFSVLIQKKRGNLQAKFDQTAGNEDTDPLATDDEDEEEEDEEVTPSPKRRKIYFGSPSQVPSPSPSKEPSTEETTTPDTQSPKL